MTQERAASGAGLRPALATAALSRSLRTALTALASCVALWIAGTPASLAQQSNAVELDAIAALLGVEAGATIADVGAGAGF